MSMHSRILAVVLTLGLSGASHAQPVSKVVPKQSEIIAELIGAPVFAADGPQIGEVADVAFDEEGRPHRLRMSTSAILGFGERIIQLPPKSFIVLRGAVVVDFPTEAVQSLPHLDEPGDEK
jgi:hypothetical protein